MGNKLLPQGVPFSMFWGIIDIPKKNKKERRGREETK